MIPSEFFRKIRRIEIRTNRLVDTLFAGEYRSIFKGKGMEFLDVREYQIGDDVRTIDWKVTARMNLPHVKIFAQERELMVFLVVDNSGSTRFGSTSFKSELAAEIAATIAFSAIRNNDKVGLLFFTDRVEKFIPPRKGRTHVLRLIRDILYFQPKNKKTDPVVAIEFLLHSLKRRGIIFLITDFIGPGFELENLRRPLGLLNRSHDTIVIMINDQFETQLPNLGAITIEDAETGRVMTVDTSDPRVRRQFKLMRQEQQQKVEVLLISLGIDRISVTTDEDYIPRLHRFFQERARRLR
ncbi:MAG TPA: DUF58 domain-containing protein [bacterium (Candidatus Stahlbacteria)]|nr:DUF58 domain-containing protein [Candidatus Stahlbacteria bacterium]